MVLPALISGKNGSCHRKPLSKLLASFGLMSRSALLDVSRTIARRLGAGSIDLLKSRAETHSPIPGNECLRALVQSKAFRPVWQRRNSRGCRCVEDRDFQAES